MLTVVKLEIQGAKSEISIDSIQNNLGKMIYAIVFLSCSMFGSFFDSLQSSLGRIGCLIVMTSCAFVVLFKSLCFPREKKKWAYLAYIVGNTGIVAGVVVSAVALFL